MKNIFSLQYSLLAGLISLATVCSGQHTNKGYYRIPPQISKDATDKIKAKIRSISNDLFLPFEYTGANGIKIGYRLLGPEKKEEKEKLPLVLVLHGSGGVGTDNVSQMSVFPKFWALPDIREKYRAYIVAPQFPQRSSNYVMDTSRHVLRSQPDPCLTTALQLIDSLKKALPVDENRIYVMGFSMGASSSYNALILRPDLFAGAVAISGIPQFDQPQPLLKTPLWIVHGNADQENPFASDSLFYKEFGHFSKQLRFWEINHLAHDIYYKLYAEDMLPKWLFDQRKRF